MFGLKTTLENLKTLRPPCPSTLGDRMRSARLEQMGRGEEAVVFKARPNTITHKVPFWPKKEARTPLVVQPFKFDQRVTEKEALRMRMEEEQRREREQKEKEITRMRQHSAQPIRRYKPVTVKKSEVPLTVPHSPNFFD
ncbi:tpx2 [Pungitius sinensis]